MDTMVNAIPEVITNGLTVAGNSAFCIGLFHAAQYDAF